MGNHFYYLNLFWIMHEDCDVLCRMRGCDDFLCPLAADVPCEKEGFEHLTIEHKRSSCLSSEESQEQKSQQFSLL